MTDDNETTPATAAQSALKAISATLGNGHRPSFAERMKRIQGELKAGSFVHRKKNGEEVARNLSATAQLQRVVQLVKGGVPVPTEVQKRFDWAEVRDSVRQYADAKSVAPDAVLAALGLSNGKPAKPVARKGAAARAN